MGLRLAEDAPPPQACLIEVPDLPCVVVDGAVGAEDARTGDIGQAHALPAQRVIVVELRRTVIGCRVAFKSAAAMY